MNIDAVTATVLAALVGGGFSTISALGTVWIIKRAELKQHHALHSLEAVDSRKGVTKKRFTDSAALLKTAWETALKEQPKN